MQGRILWGAVGYASAGCIAIIAAAMIPAPYPIQITALKLVSAVAFGGSALLLPLGLGFTKAGVLPFGIVKSGVVLTAAAVGLQAPVIIGPPLRAALSDLRPFKQTSCDSYTGVPIDLPPPYESRVNSVAFSPDGKRLASGSRDASVRLWEVKTGEPRELETRELIGAPLLGHKGSVTSVAFSPNGKWLASGSLDRSVRLWDVETGQPIGTPLLGHKSSVTSVAFSPNGKWLASASDDNSVRLWDVETGQPIGTPLMGHTSFVRSVAFSPNGRRLASASADNSV